MQPLRALLLVGLLVSLSLIGCGSRGTGDQRIPYTPTSFASPATGTLLIHPSFESVGSKTAQAAAIEERTSAYEVRVLDDAETDNEVEPVTFQKSTPVLRVEGIPVDGRTDTVILEARDAAGDIVGVSVQKLDVVAGEQNLTAEVHRSLSGNVRFDRVLPTDSGLDYAAPQTAPIVNARVLLVDGSGTTLKSTVSGADGTYRFDTKGLVGNVRVRVTAETLEPPIKVVDNTSSASLYVVDSAPVDVSTGLLDLKAPVTYVAGTGYTARSGAPFACLEACRRAGAAFRAARPGIVFPLLTVNWSVNNAPVVGDKSRGEINTSHYTSGNLYILGKENQDTDEFDWHVMVHEWGHYYEDKLSRSDSIGGQHSAGDLLDARVSMGEGWGNAVSAILLYPDSVYRDTSGVNQASTGVRIDMEDNTDASPGWASERSVQAIIYDVFDPATPAEQAFDQVSLSLGQIHDVMSGPEKGTRGLTTIFSFINGCQSKVPGFATAVRPLLAKHSLLPVSDDFGSGETNNGGDAANLPLYRTAVVNGDPVTVSVTRSDSNQNRANSNRYIIVSSMTTGPITLYCRSTDQVRVVVYKNGVVLGYDDYPGGGAEQGTSFGNVSPTDSVIVTVTGLTLSKTYSATITAVQ